MRTSVLLRQQHETIDGMLAHLLGEHDSGRRLLLVVDVVEHVTAHLAVIKNVVHPAVDDCLSTALTKDSAHGSTAARRALLLVARACCDDELCATRVRELRAAMDAYAARTWRLVELLELVLPERAGETLCAEAERFFAACMGARKNAVRGSAQAS
jgi:hypothetical protein